MTFADELRAMGACDDAIAWVGDRTLAEAWTECERSNWMMWLLRRRVSVDKRLSVALAIAFAERVLHLARSSEARAAVDAARGWLADAAAAAAADADGAASAERKAQSDIIREHVSAADIVRLWEAR